MIFILFIVFYLKQMLLKPNFTPKMYMITTCFVKRYILHS